MKMVHAVWSSFTHFAETEKMFSLSKCFLLQFNNYQVTGLNAKFLQQYNFLQGYLHYITSIVSIVGHMPAVYTRYLHVIFMCNIFVTDQ